MAYSQTAEETGKNLSPADRGVYGCVFGSWGKTFRSIVRGSPLSQSARRNGAPPVLVVRAMSRAWATPIAGICAAASPKGSWLPATGDSGFGVSAPVFGSMSKMTNAGGLKPIVLERNFPEGSTMISPSPFRITGNGEPVTVVRTSLVESIVNAAMVLPLKLNA